MSETDGLPAGRRNWVMGCAILGVTLSGLDSAIANIALPTIAHELRAGDAATVWVVNIYQIALTVCLLPLASLGESLGLKRVYDFGLALFTLGSLCCALSPTLPLLVASRLVQGIGGSCVAGLGGALVRTIYPRRLLGQGFALVALAVAISGALGPTIAALILSVANRAQPRRFDFTGAALNAAALGLVVLGVDGLGGASKALALGELAIGASCGVLLFWQQSKMPRAMLPLDLLRIPLFALSVCVAMCAYSAQILAYVSLPFLFQTVMHRSAVATGLLVTPWPVLVACAAPIAGRLSARYPAALLGSLGLIVLTAGLLSLAAMPAQPQVWNVAWRMGLCGIGFGFYQTPNNLTIMTAGPPERNAAASAMLAVARTVGWSLGSALVALIFGISGSSGAVTCLMTGAGFAAAGAVISVSRSGAKRAG
jgi:DHA2 family multidrug resistance protein-like MFS transporter